MSYALGSVLSGKNGHIAPSRYWMLTEEEIRGMVNGCGPGSWKIDLIPDKIGNIDFTESCNIHDICYIYGMDEEDKRLGDRIFLFNIQSDVDRYCDENGFFDRIEMILYRETAFNYYRAVSDFGGSSFFNKSNK